MDLGAKDFLPHVESIFDDWFSKTAQANTYSPPTDTYMRSLYDQSPELYCRIQFDTNLAKLPLAVRTVRHLSQPKIAQKILEIIEWQLAGLKDPLFEIVHGPWRFSNGLFAECIETLTLIAPAFNQETFWESFLQSDVFKEVVTFVTEDSENWIGRQCRSRITRSLISLSTQLSQESFGRMYELFEKTYKQLLKTASGGESVNWDGICQLLLASCYHFDDNQTIEFLKSLLQSCENLKGKAGVITLGLVRAIMLIKGRRFLAEFKAYYELLQSAAE